MLVGHNYTRFVIFLAKTFFEIGFGAALVPRYEVLKTTISSLVQKNQFVNAFTDRVLLIMYSYQTMYINFLTIQLWMVVVRIMCFNTKALSNVSLNHFVHLHSLE